MACCRVLSLQLGSGGPSSQCAPVGPSGPWWNDTWNNGQSNLAGQKVMALHLNAVGWMRWRT